MKKNREKHQKKAWKNGHEAKFEQMVGEYQNAKAMLDSMKVGTNEYSQHQKHCDSLFAKAERFFKQHQ